VCVCVCVCVCIDLDLYINVSTSHAHTHTHSTNHTHNHRHTPKHTRTRTPHTMPTVAAAITGRPGGAGRDQTAAGARHVATLGVAHPAPNLALQERWLAFDFRFLVSSFTYFPRALFFLRCLLRFFSGPPSSTLLCVSPSFLFSHVASTLLRLSQERGNAAQCNTALER